MELFDDEICEQIYTTRFAPNVPEHVSVAGHEILRLIVAAGSLQDIAVLGRIRRWSSLPERYGIQIDGKWHATFVWNEDYGATSLRIERR